jgi:hypothetical protein
MKIFEMVSRRIVRMAGGFLGMNNNVRGADGKYRFPRGFKSEAKLIEKACWKLRG